MIAGDHRAPDRDAAHDPDRAPAHDRDRAHDTDRDSDRDTAHADDPTTAAPTAGCAPVATAHACASAPDRAQSV